MAEEIFDAIFDLEQVSAHLGMPSYDFEARGRSIVEHAINEIIAKTETYSPSAD